MASVHNSVLVALLLLSIVAALATAIAAAEGSSEAVPQLVTLPVAWRAGPRPTWTLSEEQHADRVRRHARRRATATTTTSHDDGPECVYKVLVCYCVVCELTQACALPRGQVRGCPQSDAGGLLLELH